MAQCKCSFRAYVFLFNNCVFSCFSVRNTISVISSCGRMATGNFPKGAMIFDINKFIRVPGMIVESENELKNEKQRRNENVGGKSQLLFDKYQQENDGKITQ